VDLIPEMTQGLVGLLDDTYLIFRMLQNLEQGPQELVSWDLEHPLRLMERLLPNKTARQLDAIALMAMQEVETQLADLWSRMGHPA
jgi:HJR/Mrr/RecB family endonuclease